MVRTLRRFVLVSVLALVGITPAVLAEDEVTITASPSQHVPITAYMTQKPKKKITVFQFMRNMVTSIASIGETKPEPKIKPLSEQQAKRPLPGGTPVGTFRGN